MYLGIFHDALVTQRHHFLCCVLKTSASEPQILKRKEEQNIKCSLHYILPPRASMFCISKHKWRRRRAWTGPRAPSHRLTSVLYRHKPACALCAAPLSAVRLHARGRRLHPEIRPWLEWLSSFFFLFPFHLCLLCAPLPLAFPLSIAPPLLRFSLALCDAFCTVPLCLCRRRCFPKSGGAVARGCFPFCRRFLA